MKDITTEEAIILLKDFKDGKIEKDKLENYAKGGFKLGYFYTKDIQQAIEKVLNELEKKDKIIDAMTEYIEEINYIDIDDNECEFETKHQIECPPTSCKDCIKQYFEREVKDEKN